MKKLHFLAGLIFLAMMSSCERKQLPEPVIEEPDFKLDGTLNGSPFSMIAGENNMQASAHVFQDAFGIFHYESALATQACDNCPGSLRIHCTSSQSYANGEIPTEYADIAVQELELLTTPSVQNYMAVELTAAGLNPGEFLWMLDNGNLIFGEQTIMHTFQEQGPQEVVLQVLEPTTCEAIFAQTINAGSPELCSVPFEILDLGGGLVECSLTQLLPEGLSVVGWSIDGNLFLDDITAVVAPIAPAPPHFFEAYFLNAQGIPGSYSITWNSTLLPVCPAGITWSYVTAAPELGKVSIQYQSPEGKNYTSAFAENEDPSSYFQFDEINSYDIEIAGLPTKRVRLQFSLFLVNVDDPLDVLWMENASGEMVFVIPQ